MARVHVRCWQETYRGLMSDAVLDDPGLLAARERFWTAALTDERYRANRAAVALVPVRPGLLTHDTSNGITSEAMIHANQQHFFKSLICSLTANSIRLQERKFLSVH